MNAVFWTAREALGWLATHWAGSLVALLVLPRIAQHRLAPQTEPAGWSSVAWIVVLLGTAAVNLWGHWASADARPRLREQAGRRQLSWWQRSTFSNEQAAARLGWPPGHVIWVGRLLLLAAAAAALATIVLLVPVWR